MTIATTVALLKQKVEGLIKKVDKCVMTKEFEPVKNIVYGFVGLILLSFAGALIALIIK